MRISLKNKWGFYYLIYNQPYFNAFAILYFVKKGAVVIRFVPDVSLNRGSYGTLSELKETQIQSFRV